MWNADYIFLSLLISPRLPLVFSVPTMYFTRWADIAFSSAYFFCRPKHLLQYLYVRSFTGTMRTLCVIFAEQVIFKSFVPMTYPPTVSKCWELYYCFYVCIMFATGVVYPFAPSWRHISLRFPSLVLVFHFPDFSPAESLLGKGGDSSSYKLQCM